MSKPTQLTKNATPPKSGAANATMVGAILAAIAASSCCVLPALFAVLGVSGAGAAAGLEEWRPLFLGLAAVLLGSGFYLAHRRKTCKANSDACGCPTPRTRVGKLSLWFGAIFVVGLAFYPYLAGVGVQSEKQGDTAMSAGALQTELRIEGMTCESCVSHVVNALTKTLGVVKASVDFEESSATVIYNPQVVGPQILAEVVTAMDGYYAIALSP